MFVVVHKNRILGCSTSLFVADGIRQRLKKGVLYEMLCPFRNENDQAETQRSESPKKSGKNATSRPA
jgi:hypothetical protein